MLFCQSTYLVITNDTFHWFLLSKFPLSQSEALLDLLDESRSALLECAIHVFNSVSLCPPFCCRGDIVKEIHYFYLFIAIISVEIIFSVTLLSSKKWPYFLDLIADISLEQAKIV